MSSPAQSSPSLPSRLPRFLQKPTRDRSKSETPPPSDSKSRKPSSRFLKSSSPSPSTVDAPPDPPIIIESQGQGYPSSPPSHSPSSTQPMPIPSPRARTRSDHPAASAPETQHLQSLYASTGHSHSNHTPTRINDLPTRLSGWFAHTFSSSSTDLSLPTILAQHRPPSSTNSSYDNPTSTSSTSSPRKLALTGPAALLAAAKHGRGTIDKAMRYLLDSDAVPDRSSEPIWLMGVEHPGWEAPPPSPEPAPPTGKEDKDKKRKDTVARRGRAGSWRSSSSSAASSSADGHSSPASSTSGAHSPLSSPHPHHTQSTLTSNSSSHSNTKIKIPDPALAWPPAFYADFTSRVWLTYRSHLPLPIRDARLADLEPCNPEYILHVSSQHQYGAGSAASSSTGHDSSTGGIGGSKSPTTTRKAWPWTGEKTWSADTGWGCMLRTGQSLLANALVFVHLGRDWRRPPHPVATPSYATYVKILTYFLDTPAPQAPFSVHRMALAGKELGTDVGQWFGPSVAAGAIKTLVAAFPQCGLSVAIASDGVLYESHVFTASHGDPATSRSTKKERSKGWGDRPVLVLVGVRLGIEGVNRIYWGSVKALYTFPQSIGIAGGRPSSSYYFVGAQGDNLFYLDPHYARAAVGLKPAPTGAGVGMNITTSTNIHEDEERRREKEKHRHGHGHQQRASNRGNTGSAEGTARRRSPHRSSPQSHTNTNTNVTSSSGSGTALGRDHLPSSPSPLGKEFSTSSASSAGMSSEVSSDVHERGYARSGAGHGRTHGKGRASESESGDSYDGRRERDRESWDNAQHRRDSEGGGVGGLVQEEDEDGRAPPPAYYQHRMHRVAGVGSDPRAATKMQESTSTSASIPCSPSASTSTSPNALNSPSTSTSSATPPSTDLSPPPPPLDPLQLHYINAYSAAELQTFHCERVRKMPISGLDPSMLIGFVCRDAGEWEDLRRRVGELPKAIFSIQDEPPTWPSDMDDNLGLESISDPDDTDCLLDADDDSPPRSESQDIHDRDGDEDDDRDGDGGEEEEFFDTRSGSSISRTGERVRNPERLRDSERARDQREAERRRRQRMSTDTSEEDPADPVTPGPTSRFEIGGKGVGFGEEEESFVVEDGPGDDEGEGEGDDIEDDWVDPLVPTPTTAPAPPLQHTQQQQLTQQRSQHRERKDQPPPVPVKDRTASSSSRRSASGSGSGTAKTKKQKAVPVPSVRIPETQQHYPFPVTPAEESGQVYAHGGMEMDVDEMQGTRSTEGRKVVQTITQSSVSQSQTSLQQQNQHRMHNARARDGGRTQSGGVKGILTDERGV